MIPLVALAIAVPLIAACAAFVVTRAVTEYTYRALVGVE